MSKKKSNENSQNVFGFFQKFGQALLVPIAILPAAGIMYGLGNALVTYTKFAPMFSNILLEVGKIILNNLAVLFAVGLAVGLAEKRDGTAGLAAIAGFMIFNKTLGVALGVNSEMMAASSGKYMAVLGINTLRTGIFSGIIVGLIAAWAYNRFHTIKVPDVLAFFGAKRAVPIITSFLCVLLGLVFAVVWPPIQVGIDEFATYLTEANAPLTVFVYGIVIKLLNPLGLHSTLSQILRNLGTYVSVSGEVFTGDAAIFTAQIADNVPVTAGIFSNGIYIVDMIACVGIALAIYHEAKPANRKYVAGVLLSATAVSMAVGITEPLLFSHLFVAPACFGAYCLLNGFAYLVGYLLGIRTITTFAGGITNYVFVNVLNHAPGVWLLIPLGVVFAGIFYIVFRFLIRKFDYKTLGREDDLQEEITDIKEYAATGDEKRRQNASGFVTLLGGKDNIADISCCATRLRLRLKDPGMVGPKENFKSCGALSVINYGKENMQIVIGTQVQNVLQDVQEEMNRQQNEKEE